MNYKQAFTIIVLIVVLISLLSIGIVVISNTDFDDDDDEDNLIGQVEKVDNKSEYVMYVEEIDYYEFEIFADVNNDGEKEYITDIYIHNDEQHIRFKTPDKIPVGKEITFKNEGYTAVSINSTVVKR